MKTNTKLASLYNRRLFLLRCRSEKIVPNFINDSFACLNQIVSNSLNINIKRILNLQNKLKSKILNLQFEQIHNNITNLESKSNNLKNTINDILPNYILNKFLKRQQKSFQLLFDKIKTNNLKKIEELKIKKNTINFDKNWIENLTDLDIPHNILGTLALGPKFTIKPSQNQLPIYQYLSEIENILSLNQNVHTVNINRAKVTNILTN